MGRPGGSKRIDDGIEKNRKGDAVIKIVGADGKPIDGAKVELSQTSHEFLFGCNCFVVGQMKDKNQAYEEAFAKIHNFATIGFYWGDLEPEEGKPRFEEGSSYKWRRPRHGSLSRILPQIRHYPQGTSSLVAQP